MKLPPFTYHRASSAEEAVALLADGGGDAKVVAGGQSLLPLMSMRMAAPAQLVDVSQLDELRFIREDGGVITIGGTTRHAALEAAGLDGPWQAFGDAVPLIGHLPIRTRGTIGGSLAHADATAELPLLATTFGASIVAMSMEGVREIPADAFFRSHLTTDLRPDELLVEVRFPAPPTGAVSAFEEFSERAGDFALASACVLLGVDSAGTCNFTRVGLGAVAPRPIRSPTAEAALIGARLDEETIALASEAASGDCSPRAGLHVSIEFRRELIAAMVRRALERVAGRLQQAPV